MPDCMPEVDVFLESLCSGLIIDAFGELRDQQEQVKEDMEVRFRVVRSIDWRANRGRRSHCLLHIVRLHTVSKETL